MQKRSLLPYAHVLVPIPCARSHRPPVRDGGDWQQGGEHALIQATYLKYTAEELRDLYHEAGLVEDILLTLE